MATASSAPAQHHGHPKGLYLLFATEMWERMSYYGMRVILTLYLVNKATGLGWDDKKALSLYGTYTGLVYLTPLLGGYIADRFIGQARSTIFGGTMMMIGHFLMALPGMTAFYTALGFLIIGNGFFKPNISAMVGKLYAPGDPRRDGGFTIFYIGINLGAFLGQFVCSYLGENVSWHAGFAAAGVGMGFGLAAFLAFRKKLLGSIGTIKEVKPVTLQEVIQWLLIILAMTVVSIAYVLWDYMPGAGGKAGLLLGAAAVVLFVLKKLFGGGMSTLTREEKHRIGVIFILAFFVIFFWGAFEQAGGLMNIFTMRDVDRSFFGWQVPAGWFQNFNAAFIVLLGPLFATLWSKLGERGRDPSIPTKMSFGLIFLAIGFIPMVIAAGQAESGVKAAWFLVAFAYLLHTMGELCLSPVGLSMITKLAPAQLVSLMMGIWFLANAGGNKMAGFIGGLASNYGEKQVFGGIAVGTFAAGALLLAISPLLKKMMHGADEVRPEAEAETEAANQGATGTAGA